MEPTGLSTHDTLEKMRTIVVAGEMQANGEGCLEDALCRVAFGRSWWVTPTQIPWIEEREKQERIFQQQLLKHPLYAKVLLKAQELFPKFRSYTRLWAVNDQMSREERVAVLDAMLAE